MTGRLGKTLHPEGQEKGGFEAGQAVGLPGPALQAQLRRAYRICCKNARARSVLGEAKNSSGGVSSRIEP